MSTFCPLCIGEQCSLSTGKHRKLNMVDIGGSQCRTQYYSCVRKQDQIKKVFPVRELRGAPMEGHALGGPSVRELPVVRAPPLFHLTRTNDCAYTHIYIYIYSYIYHGWVYKRV